MMRYELLAITAEQLPTAIPVDGMVAQLLRFAAIVIATITLATLLRMTKQMYDERQKAYPFRWWFNVPIIGYVFFGLLGNVELIHASLNLRVLVFPLLNLIILFGSRPIYRIAKRRPLKKTVVANAS